MKIEMSGETFHLQDDQLISVNMRIILSIFEIYLTLGDCSVHSSGPRGIWRSWAEDLISWKQLEAHFTCTSCTNRSQRKRFHTSLATAHVLAAQKLGQLCEFQIISIANRTAIYTGLGMSGSIETYWNYTDACASSTKVSPKHHGISHSWSTTDRYPMLRVGVSGLIPWPSLTHHEFWKCCADSWNWQWQTDDWGWRACWVSSWRDNTYQHISTLQTQCIEPIDPLQDAGKKIKVASKTRWYCTLCSAWSSSSAGAILVVRTSAHLEVRFMTFMMQWGYMIIIHEFVCAYWRYLFVCCGGVGRGLKRRFSFGGCSLATNQPGRESWADCEQSTMWRPGMQALRLRKTEIFCRVCHDEWTIALCQRRVTSAMWISTGWRMCICGGGQLYGSDETAKFSC